MREQFQTTEESAHERVELNDERRFEKLEVFLREYLGDTDSLAKERIIREAAQALFKALSLPSEPSEISVDALTKAETQLRHLLEHSPAGIEKRLLIDEIIGEIHVAAGDSNGGINLTDNNFA